MSSVQSVQLPDNLDPQIRPVVEYLTANGFITFASCHAGAGHRFELPMVRVAVDCRCAPSEDFDCMTATANRLVGRLIAAGYSGFSVKRVELFQTSVVPWQPRERSYVEVEFWSGWQAKEPETPSSDVQPIPMLLWCPACGERHIDEGEYATKPHHSHACQGCGLVWRPALIPTTGVQFLPGFKNETTEAR